MEIPYNEVLELIRPYLQKEKNLTKFAEDHKINYRILLYIKSGQTNLKYIKAVRQILEIYGFEVHGIQKVVVFQITKNLK